MRMGFFCLVCGKKNGTYRRDSVIASEIEVVATLIYNRLILVMILRNFYHP
jgi:hypothetical protein